MKSGQIYSLKASYDIAASEMKNSLGVDLIAGLIDTTSTVDGSKVKVYHFRADAIYPFIIKNSDFTPFLSVGAGSNLFERSTGTDVMALAAYGAGLKYKFLDYLVARADVRHILVFKPERHDNMEFTLGLTYIFGVERKPKPPVDSDKDGVPDNLDKCAATPPGVKVDKDGCPRDSDRDGVPDNIDRCSDTPKGVKVDKNGCQEEPAKIPETTKPAESPKDDRKSEPAVMLPVAPPVVEAAQPPVLQQTAAPGIEAKPAGVESSSQIIPVPQSAPALPLATMAGADAVVATERRVDKVAPRPVAGGATGKGEAGEKQAVPAEPLRTSEKAPITAPTDSKAVPAQREAGKGDLLRFNVEFDFDKATIRPRYHGLLRKAVNFLKTNPGAVAEIRGHTDSIGKASYNLHLSKRRAESVRRYLVKKSGIDAARVIVSGYGFHRPIADNRTAAGRQKNRRTEVTITIRKRGESPEGSTARGAAPKPGGRGR
ncbi:MAG: OmpA family protein [Geobacteraceae bacterium]|nr:OmpA family protein [Geobacteraceae bacterium]